MKYTNLVTSHKIKTMIGRGVSQKEVAQKLGLHRNTVSRILSGETKQEGARRIADRMAYFGLLDDAGNSRKQVVEYNHKQLPNEVHSLYCRDLHHDDPLAILMAAERFGKAENILHKVPERIDTPYPEHVVVHDDTWDEYVIKAGAESIALRQRRDGSSRLSAEGAYVSSWAVRTTSYNWGYPYRNTLRERLHVAAHSVLRRRARALDGRAFTSQYKYEDST